MSVSKVAIKISPYNGREYIQEGGCEGVVAGQ